MLSRSCRNAEHENRFDMLDQVRTVEVGRLKLWLAHQPRLIIVVWRAGLVALSPGGGAKRFDRNSEDREIGLTLSCEHPPVAFCIQGAGLHCTYCGDLFITGVELDAPDRPSLAAAANLVLISECGLGILVDFDQLRVGA